MGGGEGVCGRGRKEEREEEEYTHVKTFLFFFFLERRKTRDSSQRIRVFKHLTIFRLGNDDDGFL